MCASKHTHTHKIRKRVFPQRTVRQPWEVGPARAHGNTTRTGDIAVRPRPVHVHTVINITCSTQCADAVSRHITVCCTRACLRLACENPLGAFGQVSATHALLGAHVWQCVFCRPPVQRLRLHVRKLARVHAAAAAGKLFSAVPTGAGVPVWACRGGRVHTHAGAAAP